jgi:8-hydroxy-5-deazaflavin:NADPH oxidoreductase
MRIGILGTGGVARTLAGALAERGHEVVMGSRDPAAALARDEVNQQTGTTLSGWHVDHPSVVIGTFAETASHGEVLLLATSGSGALYALEAGGADRLRDPVVIDITNPIVRTPDGVGLDPAITDSLAEHIQRAYPNVRVVKALNTVTAALMIDPGSVADGDHTLPICGDHEEAKEQVARWLGEWFGWRDVLDLGDLTAARAQEAYLLFWLRLMQSTGTPMVTTKVLR